MKKILSTLLMLLLVFSVLPLALGVQDNETEDVCVTNEDCDEDEVCTDGECGDIEEDEDECTTDADCDEGKVCTNSECEDIEEEDEEEVECTTDDDCDEGKVCTNSECEDIEEDEDECTTDADCDEDKVCTDGECEDEEEVDQETEEEVEEMHTPHGAEVRLLQLEKAIDRNIARGQHIIDSAKEDHNVTELEAILAEMEALLTQVQDADPSAEDAVQQFVDLKKDAIELSKQFRDTARELLGPSEAGRLRARVKEIKGKQEQRLRTRIRKKIQEFNGERVLKICEILEIDCEDLKEQLEAIAITKAEIKEQIREKMQSMSKEEKKETFAELKEEGVKRNVFKKAAVQRAKENFRVRKELRLTSRLDKLGELDDEEKRLRAEERIKTRLEKLNDAEERALNRLEQIEIRRSTRGDTE
jgi:hypothetical protein